MAITDPELRAILQALGTGGTPAMAESVRNWINTNRPTTPPPPPPPAPAKPATTRTGPPIQDALGLAEVVKLTSIPLERLRKLRANPKYSFPEPIKTLSATPLWDTEQINQWKDGNPD